MTFGARNSNKLTDDMNIKKEKEKEKDKKLISTSLKNKENSKFSIVKEVDNDNSTSFDKKQDRSLHNLNTNSLIVFSNKIGEHNSFLNVIINILFAMSKIRNYVIFDMLISETDYKNKILINLQNLFKKMQAILKNNSSDSVSVLSLNELRKTLSDSFQSRRKFLLDYPDDPTDVFYALINSLHSFHVKGNLNEIKDSTCNMKCFAHKNFFMDLYRIDQCECKGRSKRLYSFHNYVFDVPLDRILDISQNLNFAPTELSKTFRNKAHNSNNNAYSQSTTLTEGSISISDLKGKLFLYFKTLISQIKINCPEKGTRCQINKTDKTFYLSNIPTYLSFNLTLTGSVTMGKNFVDILKTFILIPKFFELGHIFNYGENKGNTGKYFYELLGGVCIGSNKNYTSFYKNSLSQEWLHFDDEKVVRFQQFSELISNCLKYSEMPILLFYQLNEKFNDRDKDLTTEEINNLERFCRNLENLNIIVQNQFRPIEDIIKYVGTEEGGEMPLSPINNNSNIGGPKGVNKFKRGEKTASTISNNNTGDNSSTTNNNNPNKSNSTISNSRQNSNSYYECFFCGYKNKIEDNISHCSKCLKNNERMIEEVKRKNLRSSDEHKSMAKSSSKSNIREDRSTIHSELENMRSTSKGKFIINPEESISTIGYINNPQPFVNNNQKLSRDNSKESKDINTRDSNLSVKKEEVGTIKKPAIEGKSSSKYEKYDKNGKIMMIKNRFQFT